MMQELGISFDRNTIEVEFHGGGVRRFKDPLQALRAIERSIMKHWDAQTPDEPEACEEEVK